MSRDFSVTVAVSDDRPSVATVGVSGEFDAARVTDFEGGTSSIPQGTACLVIDLVRTTVIDSSALGALIRLRDRCAAAGTEVRTLIGSTYQSTLMSVTGLDELLGVERVPSGD